MTSTRRLALWLVAAACALVGLDALAGESFGRASRRYVLLDSGRAQCRIVVPKSPEPEESDAAKLLQDTLAARGQGRPDIVSDGAPGPSGTVQIHVGRTGLATANARLPEDLDADGFVIRPVSEDHLILLGGRAVSTFYAATEFLERYAGALWVWPGPHGAVIPQAARLEVEVRDQVCWPAFRARRFSGMKRTKMALYRIHLNRREVRSEFHHNVGRVLKPKTYWKSHPDYFAEVAGKRIEPKRVTASWQACTSNPDVVQVFIDAAKRQFDRRPWVISFSVSQNDGGGFCTCQRCQSLDVPGVEGISDRYFTFLNAVADGVAQSHPDKFVCCLAYGRATRNVPARLTLRANTMIYAVVPTLDDVHESIRQWSKAAPNLGVYFWMHGKAVPKFYPHRLAKYLQFLRAHRVREVYAEIYQDKPARLASWELDAPRVWMAAKLLWDPDADIDALMARFCSRFYGRASAPMLRYYKTCEAAWERREHPDDFGRRWRDLELDTYSTQDVDAMEACLAEALRLAESEPVKARLAMQKKAFGRAALWVRQIHLGDILARVPARDEACADRILDSIERAEEQSAEMAKVGPLPFGSLAHSSEAAVDAKLDEVSRALRDRAVGYWQERLPRYPRAKRFIQTQICLLRGGLANLARNPGFEQKAKGAGEGDKALEWEAFDAAGWGRWIRPNTQGNVVTVEGAGQSGKRGVRLTGCTAACALQKLQAKPGERYRVRCWARAAGPKPKEPVATPAGTLSIKWMDARGKWLSQPPAIVSELPRAAAQWQRLSCMFTVPPRVGQIVILLGVKDQRQDESVWFDDLVVERVAEAGAQ